ncbi:cupin domain-containing protein [Mesorhizobium sp. CN2-181]|uniref:cupin domain-containing protein n=1 Tax=Mesorhizobium yinganensis TaxID=3157707 RepID=UPI0032B7508D
MLRMALIAVSLAMLTVVSAAQDAPAGIKRTPLQKIAFPEGYSTVMGLAEIAPGASSGSHTHPGIETGYILEGEVLMSVDGQPDQTLKAGDSYLIPAGVVHDVKAIGNGPSKALATYVAEADKPLASPAP